MSRRTRALLAVASAACLGLAAVLVLLAVDVRRWQDGLRADDVRYVADAGAADLWRTDTILPWDPARRLLGVGDDIRLRDGIRALRQGRLEAGFTSDPAIALPRAEAVALLTAVAKGDDSAERRSRALGLLGVYAFAGSQAGGPDREQLLTEAVGAFQAAIEADPANDEAKGNLERALQRRAALQAIPGGGLADPSHGGPGARGAGAGNAGSGY